MLFVIKVSLSTDYLVSIFTGIMVTGKTKENELFWEQSH